MTYTIDIVDNTAALLARVGSIATEKGMNSAMAEEVRDYTKKWFVRLNSERAHKGGGKRTNFYKSVKDSVNTVDTPSGFVLNITHVGIRQRWLGGPIVAGKSGKANPRTGKVPTLLTISACADSYGKPAWEFNNLRFAILGGKPALVEAEATQIKIVKAGKTGKRRIKVTGSTLEVAAGKKRKVFYWLKHSVYQNPDPTIMPTESEFAKVATEAGKAYIYRKIARQ